MTRSNRWSNLKNIKIEKNQLSFQQISYFGLTKVQPIFVVTFKQNLTLNPDNSFFSQWQINLSSFSFFFFKLNFFLKVFFSLLVFFMLTNLFYINHSCNIVLCLLLILIILAFFYYMGAYTSFYLMFSLFISYSYCLLFILNSTKFSKNLNVFSHNNGVISPLFFILNSVSSDKVSVFFKNLSQIFNSFDYLSALTFKNKFSSNLFFKNLLVSSSDLIGLDTKYFSLFSKNIGNFFFKSSSIFNNFLMLFFYPQWLNQSINNSNWLFSFNLYFINNILPISNAIQSLDFWKYHRSLKLQFDSSFLSFFFKSFGNNKLYCKGDHKVQFENDFNNFTTFYVSKKIDWYYLITQFSSNGLLWTQLKSHNFQKKLHNLDFNYSGLWLEGFFDGIEKEFNKNQQNYLLNFSKQGVRYRTPSEEVNFYIFLLNFFWLPKKPLWWKRNSYEGQLAIYKDQMNNPKYLYNSFYLKKSYSYVRWYTIVFLRVFYNERAIERNCKLALAMTDDVFCSIELYEICREMVKNK